MAMDHHLTPFSDSELMDSETIDDMVKFDSKHFAFLEGRISKSLTVVNSTLRSVSYKKKSIS
jgi:hypothetical protein